MVEPREFFPPLEKDIVKDLQRHRVGDTAKLARAGSIFHPAVGLRRKGRIAVVASKIAAGEPHEDLPATDQQPLPLDRGENLQELGLSRGCNWRGHNRIPRR